MSAEERDRLDREWAACRRARRNLERMGLAMVLAAMVVGSLRWVW